MSDKMTDITQEIINAMQTTKVKNIVITDKISPRDRAIIESVRRLKNPFRTLTVQDVMRDLKVCDTVAYKIFKHPDFPSIIIGRTYRVMLLSYLIWKLQKHYIKYKF